MPMVAVRVDASAEMGSGHARRCFALAARLQTLGATVLLVSRPLDAASAAVFASAPCEVAWLAPPGQLAPPDLSDGPVHAAWARVHWQEDARELVALLAPRRTDWIFVDHYAFDARWHQAVSRGLGVRMAVMDDLADRPLHADLLLDQNLSPDPQARYRPRLSPGGRTRCLFGPRHALLDAAYHDAPRHVVREQVRSIGIFMGGTDPARASLPALRACLAQAAFTGEVEVISTRANPGLDELRAACAASPRVRLTLDEPQLAAFFARHDLQVGAGGGSTWERCCMGAPTIAVEVAANQHASLMELARRGVVCLASLPGLPPPDGAEPLDHALGRLIASAGERRALAEAGAALVDGLGAERVALALLAHTLDLRAATLKDGPLLHAWRNHPAIRRTARDAGEIALSEHLRWMERVLADASRHLFIACIGPRPVGSLRWDRLDDGSHEVSLYLDPALMGLGLGAMLLAQGEAWLAAHQPGTLARAIVLSDNPASAALFTQAGYQPKPGHGGHYSKQL